MIIDYTKEFREQAKLVFPKWRQLLRAIEYNDGDGVRIALGNIKTHLSPEEVAKSFDTGKISSLYKKAKQLIAVKELENSWYNEYDRSYEEITQRNEIGKLEEEIFGRM
jgi:hypothetical protein